MNCWQNSPTHDKLLRDWNIYQYALSHTVPTQASFKPLVTDGVRLVNFILGKAFTSNDTHVEDLVPFICELIQGTCRENLLLKAIYSYPDVVRNLLQYILSLSLEDMATLFDRLPTETTIKYLCIVVTNSVPTHNVSFALALKTLKRFLCLRHDAHSVFVHLLPVLRPNLERGAMLCNCASKCNKNDVLFATEKVTDRTSVRFVCLQFWNYIARQDLFMNSVAMKDIINDWCTVIAKPTSSDRQEVVVSIISSIFYHRRKDEWFACMEPLRHAVKHLLDIARSCADHTLWTASCCALVQMWPHFCELYTHANEFFSILLRSACDPLRTVMALYCLEHISEQVLPLQDVPPSFVLNEIFLAAGVAIELISSAEDLRYLIEWIRIVHGKYDLHITVAYQDLLLSLFSKIHDKIRSSDDDEYDHFYTASFVNCLYAFIEKFPKSRAEECHNFLDFCIDRVEEYFAVEACFERENDYAESVSCINYSEYLCTTIMLMTSSERENFLNEERAQRLHALIYASLRDEQRLGLRDFVYRLTGCLTQVQLLDRVILSQEKPEHVLTTFVFHTLVPMMVADIPRMFKQCTDESTLHRCVLLSALNTLGEILGRYAFNDTVNHEHVKQIYLDDLIHAIFKICRYNYKVIMIDSDNRVDGIAQNITFEAALLLLARLGMVYTSDIAPLLWVPIIDDGDQYDSIAMKLCVAGLDNGGDYIRGLYILLERFIEDAASAMSTQDIDTTPLLSVIQRSQYDNRKERQWKRIRIMLNIIAGL
jgi:hypothetical protein